MNYFLRFLAFCFFLISCTSQKNLSLTGKSHLKLLGEYDVPYNQSFNNTTIGGLSGIDYDNKHKLYYLISDDRSDINPSRFYTAKISISAKGIDSVVFVSVKNLLQPGGTVYPNSKQDPYHTPDPEAIRYNPKTNQLVWSSEGERIVRKNISVLEDPSVRIISTDGNYIDSFVLPPNMHMQAVEKGPRQNGVFEGISFSDNYRKLFVSVEEPLYEDGPRAGLYDSSAWIRIIEFDVRSKKPLGEYAYKIDPVAYPPNPPGAFKINGVPDILAINNHQLLVIERSFSTGRLPCTIKVYLAELNGASDVMYAVSLKNGTFKSVEKRLILNMDDLGIFTDNIEGVTVGPKLSNGHSTLIFVSDNNFSKVQVTQLLLFEVQ
ncbi:MAG: esterase-like activity of phytase family protein [Flavisolibacter sp.]